MSFGSSIPADHPDLIGIVPIFEFQNLKKSGHSNFQEINAKTLEDPDPCSLLGAGCHPGTGVRREGGGGPFCKVGRYEVHLFIYFIYLFYFATHKQHYKVLIKRRKEEERMMTIVARRPKRN